MKRRGLFRRLRGDAAPAPLPPVAPTIGALVPCAGGIVNLVTVLGGFAKAFGNRDAFITIATAGPRGAALAQQMFALAERTEAAGELLHAFALRGVSALDGAPAGGGEQASAAAAIAIIRRDLIAAAAVFGALLDAAETEAAHLDGLLHALDQGTAL